MRQKDYAGGMKKWILAILGLAFAYFMTNQGSQPEQKELLPAKQNEVKPQRPHSRRW